MAKEHSIKRKNRNLQLKEKYGRIFFHRGKKSTGFVSSYGEPNRQGIGLSMFSSSGFTDPNNAVTRLSFLLGKENYFLDYGGLPKKGELFVKTEGRGRNKKLYVALDKRLGAKSIWKRDSRAMILEDYIFSQLSSCVKRNYGTIYTIGLNRIEYFTLLEIAEKNKNVGLSLLSISNGSKKNLESLFKEIKEAKKKKED